MKTLLWDIELSLAMGYFYPSKKPQFINATQIKHKQFMISAAWKWTHQKRIHAVSVIDDKQAFNKNHRDDFVVIKKLHEVLSEADVIVGHNSDGFDLKHFNYRCVLHGLPPIPPVQTVDTLKHARQLLNAPSNSMDNLLKDFGHIGKQEKPTFCEWVSAAEGCKKTIKKIVKYNRHDIEGQDFLYHKLRPYMKTHPNKNVTLNENFDVCPKCASPNLTLAKKRKNTNAGTRYQYQCDDCHGYATCGKNLIKVNLR